MLIIWAERRVPVPLHPADRCRVEELVQREMEGGGRLSVSSESHVSRHLAAVDRTSYRFVS
jgi:hypothetical protein